MTCASSRLALVCVLFWAVPGVADDQPADQLFREGRTLLKDGRIAEACERFEASLALDRAFGTLLNLGDCWERLGRTASAWRAFGDAAELARHEGRVDRVQLAGSRRATIEARLGRLRIELEPGAPLEIRVDGRHLDAGELGAPLPLDPGPHLVEARGEGRPPWRAVVELVEPGTRVVRVPGSRAARPAPVDLPPGALDVDPGAGRRRAGWIVAGAGVAVVGAGAFFGVRAARRWNDAQDGCGETGCPAPAIDLGTDAGRDADLSTGLVAGGLAVVATGVILWLTAPHPQLRPSPRGVAAAWRF